MYEIECLDERGDAIYNFTQWDMNREITIKIDWCDKNYLKYAPNIHYSHRHSKDAVVVRSNVTNHDTIKAPVPNCLLQHPYPIIINIYLTDSRDASKQSTILYTEIPVRERAKPSDYTYVENITRVTAEQIKNEVERDVAEIKRQTVNEINDKKLEIIAEGNKAKESILSVRDEASSFVEKTKGDINKVKNDTVSYINSKKSEFETHGSGIISDAQKIKDDVQKTYTDTVAIAGDTAEKIERDIRDMLDTSGVSLQVSDDGNGACTMSIVIK